MSTKPTIVHRCYNPELKIGRSSTKVLTIDRAGILHFFVLLQVCHLSKSKLEKVLSADSGKKKVVSQKCFWCYQTARTADLAPHCFQTQKLRRRSTTNILTSETSLHFYTSCSATWERQSNINDKTCLWTFTPGIEKNSKPWYRTWYKSWV